MIITRGKEILEYVILTPFQLLPSRDNIFHVFTFENQIFAFKTFRQAFRIIVAILNKLSVDN